MRTDHLEILIHSYPQIPDRTNYILNNDKKNPIYDLTKIGSGLEKQGVDYLAIPCIIAHYFYDELSRAIHIPIVHLIHEIRQYLEKNKFNA